MADLLPAVTAVIGVFVGAILTPRVTAGQAHRGWLRDKRAAIYEKYAEVLQQVECVVNYDDKLNLRLKNEAQEQLLEASRGLDQVASAFAVYASEAMKARAERIRRSFWDWEYGTTLRPLNELERAELSPEEQQLHHQGPWKVEAHPMDDDYPWDRIEVAGKKVVAEMEELLATIRSELRVAEAPWYKRTYIWMQERR